MTADRNLFGESRDLKQERDSEAYQAMLEKVREEWTELGVPFKPDELAVHCEAMRRLKAQSDE
jgi:hypothetical protein